MTRKLTTAIVGAGVIGLSVARSLAASKYFDVLVIESTPSIGHGISSRNSEVIHGGIYYPKNSNKALHCVKGRELLYQYLISHDIPHRKCGKLIVATDEKDIRILLDIFETAKLNGLPDLKILEGHDVSNYQPNLHCLKAIWSPMTGIFDTHSFMQSLRYDAESIGANFIFNCNVDNGEILSNSINLITNQGPLECDLLINCGGLNSTHFISKIIGFPKEKIPLSFYCKGNYFKLKGHISPFTSLVYPVPSGGGLGVHATIDLSGATRFGPDSEWLRTPPSSSLSPSPQYDNDMDAPYIHTTLPPSNQYQVDETRCQAFYHEIRKYWPDLPDHSLEPDYSGIRPKLHGPHFSSQSTYLSALQNHSPKDFYIQGPEIHGVKGVINLFGIESPGLTSSLSIGEMVLHIALQSINRY